jgi:hypothetical protein
MNTTHSLLAALILLGFSGTLSSPAAVAYSQPVLDREPIYSADPGDDADRFTLSSDFIITGVRFWGGYGIYSVPGNDPFSVSFWGDHGLNQPQPIALRSFARLAATRTPTGLKTWPGDPVFEYELVLPQPVALQRSTPYYLSVKHENGTWGWSGAGWGNFWWRSSSDSPWVDSSPGNPHHLAFELLAATNEPAPPRLVLLATLRWEGLQLTHLAWTNNGACCVLEGAGRLTGPWRTLSTPWITNANWVSTVVAGTNSSQVFRLRRN